MLFVRYLLVASFSWIPEEQKTREAVIVDAHRRYFFSSMLIDEKNAMDIALFVFFESFLDNAE